MKKIALLFLLLGLLYLGTTATQAQKPDVPKALNLPEQAKTSDVVYLGRSVDPKTQQLVEGYAFIKRVDGHGKPSGVGSGNKPKASACYAFMANGAKWKSLEGFVVNGTNNQGIDSNKIFSLTDQSITKWEKAAENAQILGAGTEVSYSLEADEVSPDGLNEVYFGDIAEPNVIGVTIVWGIFGGKTSNRVLVEWDQVYDQVDFAWSDSGEAGKMDFENISTHEMGHTFGLADLYSSDCIDETMYGYAGNGETNKRDLNVGDIAGIKALY